MRLRYVLVVLATCSALYCQNVAQPLTQVEACRKFKSSVVEVAAGSMRGTGFIVDPNGWIVTALHVVADPNTLVSRGSISVSLFGHPTQIPAEIVSPLDNLARLRDFAILKVAKENLPSLVFGNEVDVEEGSPIAIIGLPLSATFGAASNSVPPFCLTGSIAAKTSLALGNLQFRKIIYFQGVSVKGISGAPIILLQTGKVIGIVSTKLTGIGPALDDLRKNTSAGGDVQIIGTEGNQFGLGSSFTSVINVLDDQLANGLGSGTGASDVAVALNEAKRAYKQTRPN
jgi:S1-C subfamily serine protease